MSAVVAIVGRPNVGKSTLFNRLIGKRRAIESDVPGTTRDRLYHMVDVHGIPAILVDTGGLELGNTGGDIEDNIQAQSKVAIEGADVILFVVDVRHDLTSEDFHAADLLRRCKKPVILVANKCDNPSITEQRYGLFELGFGDPLPITALHSFGFSELESAITTELKKSGFEKATIGKVDDNRTHIAFLGRPNVGKSTMVNSLLGEERVIVSDVAGTTRDSTEIPFDFDEHEFTLIDTAGVRRRGKLEKGIEKFSVLRTLQSVEQADVCVLMLDAEEGITNQDCHISEFILEQRKGLILVVNKLDLFKGEERDEREQELIHALKTKMAYLPWAPVVFTSALRHKNIFKVLELTQEIMEQRKKNITQDDLNVWLDAALTKHPPKGTRGKRRFSVSGVRQTSSEPPAFVFDCEWPEIMHFSYGRYLENELRRQFGFVGTGVQLTFKKSSDRAARRRRRS